MVGRLSKVSLLFMKVLELVPEGLCCTPLCYAALAKANTMIKAGRIGEEKRTTHSEEVCVSKSSNAFNLHLNSYKLHQRPVRMLAKKTNVV